MAYVLTDPGTAVVSGIYTEQIASLHDIFKPQMIPTLYARYGNQYMPMFRMLEGMGRSLPVAADEWSGWEENWYHQTILTSGASAAGTAPGASVTITLDPSRVDSKGNFYPREGVILSLPGTYMQVRVSNIDTTSGVVLTLEPQQSTDTIPAIASGTTLSITSTAFGAGTGQPKGTVLATTKRSFVAQIFKETIGAEGSQLVNEKWYQMIDNGKNVKAWYSPGYMRGEYLRDLAIDGAFTWGNETDNIVVPSGVDGAGNAVKTTKGIMRHATEGGKTLTYTAGAFTPTDLDAVGLYYKSQGITSGFSFGWIGAEFMNDIENGTAAYLGNISAPDYTSVVKNVFGGSKEFAVSLGFQSIKKGGIVHILKPMDAWSNPKTLGAPGYDMPKYGLFTPLSKFSDPKTGVVMDNIASRYRAMDGYSRKFETWTVAGAGRGLKVTDIDKTNTFFRTHMGLQAFKTNQFVIAHPS